MTAPAMSTGELTQRLQRHYIKPGEQFPGGIFLPEVGWNGGGNTNGTGGTCDAIYVGFTSTSGRVLVGHELKISRADWVKELNSPGKADGWADECHQWYLVVSDPAIVRDGELPAGWGLMAPGRSKTRMDIRVVPDTKRGHHPSWLAVRSIMARQDTLRAGAITGARRRAQDEAEAKIREQVEQEVARRQGISPEVERARDLIKAMRERSEHLPAGDTEKLVDAVCEVLQGRRLMEHLAGIAQNRLNTLERAVCSLRDDWQYKHLVEELKRATGDVEGLS